MLKLFYQNLSVGMTKEAYFEMCEALGAEPVEEEIPVELYDFPEEAQSAILFYNRLRDDWDSMNGNYLGKSLIGLKDTFDILEIPIEDRRFIIDCITVIDNTRNSSYASQRANKEANEKKD